MMASGVLVLDQSYRPVGHIPPREAAMKLVTHEAFPVAGATIIAVFRSENLVLNIPSVISLKVYVPIPRKLSRHITNRLLFARDEWKCQYCGTHKRDLDPGVKLTRDHVKPVDAFEGATRAIRKSLANTWENVTTACSRCNCRKANRTPMQSGMWPKTTPKRPRAVLVTIIDDLDDEQMFFVKPFLRS